MLTICVYIYTFKTYERNKKRYTKYKFFLVIASYLYTNFVNYNFEIFVLYKLFKILNKNNF